MCTRSHISEEGVHEGENDIVVATDALTTLFNRHFLDNFVKRLLAILVCTLAALLCAAPASPALGEDGDALTVGVPVDRCPMFYQDASTGELVGIGAIFSAIDTVQGIEVKSIFTDGDLPKYDNFAPNSCPLCKQGIKVDALINSFGYSKL